MESKEIHERKILIWPTGYEESRRSTTDGVVIFGAYAGGEPRNFDMIQLETCDYVVETDQYGFG